MNFDLTFGEAASIIVQIGTIVGVVFTLKSDMKWLRVWCQEHKELDDTRHEEMKEDIRSIQNRI